MKIADLQNGTLAQKREDAVRAECVRLVAELPDIEGVARPVKWDTAVTLRLSPEDARVAWAAIAAARGG